MRHSIIAVLLALTFGQVAAADWAEDLKTLPPAGTTVPTTISTWAETFYFIAAESTTDSSWLALPDGVSIDISYDSDTTSATMGAGTGAVQVMWIPGVTGDRPSDQDDSLEQEILLGATLDGVCAESGTPNCRINNLTGPGYLKINVSAATAAGDTSLVTIVVK